MRDSKKMQECTALQLQSAQKYSSIHSLTLEPLIGSVSPYLEGSSMRRVATLCLQLYSRSCGNDILMIFGSCSRIGFFSGCTEIEPVHHRTRVHIDDGSQNQPTTSIVEQLDAKICSTYWYS